MAAKTQLPVIMTGPRKEPVRLLRKPRAPVPIPAPPLSPPPKSYTSEVCQPFTYPSTPGIPPAPSEVNSMMSPPPPQMRYENNRDRTASSRKPMGLTLRKGDLKYILDPVVREKTHLGTYVEGKKLVKPYRHRGPEHFPLRMPKQPKPIPPSILFHEHLETFQETPSFCLEDFITTMSHVHQVPLGRTKQIMYSRQTYTKMQKLLAEYLHPKKETVSQIDIRPPSAMQFNNRIPERQLLIEMASLVKDQMTEVLGGEMKSVIRTLPKYSPDYKPGVAAPHTEIVLYEDHSKASANQKLAHVHHPNGPVRDHTFHTGESKYFQGSRRTASPFASSDEFQVSPSELAVLDSLLSGGQALSLKANFISELPDIELLRLTLVYLNLSFNEFRVIPTTVLNIENLSVLKLRNNPLKEIPYEIARLKNLKSLVFSYCLISELPISMFSLKNLEQLDVSYNRIQFIPSEISQLGRLRELNIEGNQIPALSYGCLKLPSLRYLRVRNNFMHPLFWKENTQNQPQKLTDLCALNVLWEMVLFNHVKLPRRLEFKRLTDLGALCFRNAGLENHYDSLPDGAKRVINSCTICECCRGPMFGPGLRIVRPVSKIYGIKNLPFLFHSCSPYCRQLFLSSTDTLADILYGDMDMQEDQT